MEIEVGNYNEEEVKQTIKRIKEKMEAMEKFESDFKEKYGITTYYFLKEMFYVLEHSNTTAGKTTTGKTITTDFGYVISFVNDIIEEVKTHKED